VGPIDQLREAAPGTAEALNLVAGSTRRRRSVRERIDRAGVPCASVVAPDIDLEGVSLAGDVLIYSGARIGAEAQLAADTCVFPGAVIGHEARVGPGVVIAPNAVLNARVVLGEGAYVGANATILPDLRIGAWATVGAGSTVIGDVADHGTVLGVPAEPVTADGEDDVACGALDAGSAERLVMAVWSALLGMPDIHPQRSFFDLGGNSLLALRARQMLRLQTGRDLGIVDMYRYPTVRALARHLAATTLAPNGAAQRGMRRREALLDAAMRRPG
jgi:acetyltransferase-like isoleucine patch superfamily enzyme